MEELKKLAVEENGKIWAYFDKAVLTEEDKIAMLEAAYTSLALWRKVGTEINIARGHYMIAKAACFANIKELSFVHAKLCEESTQKADEGKKDFDQFYALEILARAASHHGDSNKANEYLTQARSHLETIENDKDKEYCVSDLNSGPWFGLKI